MTAHRALASDLLAAVEAVTTDRPAGGRPSAFVRRYLPPAPDEGGQYLLMLKPELLAEAATATDAGGLLDRVLDRLADGGLRLGAVRVVGAAELTARRVVEQHYAVLNRVSLHGLDAVPPEARRLLAARHTGGTGGTGDTDGTPARILGGHQLLGERPDLTPARILGGHQLLGERPDLTPAALDAFARNLPVAKAAAGVYTTELLLDGERLVVLNAFHPLQLDHFQRPAGAVAFLSCTTHRPTDEVRREVIGATDPAEALPGSVKHMLYGDRAAFTHWKVCTRLNGIHLSPGPVEAMFTIRRYFADDWSPMPLAATALGGRLLAAGADERALSALADNPVVAFGGGGHLFDVTEDLTVAESESLLLRLLRTAPTGSSADSGTAA